MRLFADSNIEGQMVEALRLDGHDVLYAREIGTDPGDEVLLLKAASESRTVLTADLDFGELVTRDYEFNSGIVLLRLDPLSLKQRIGRVSEVLKVVSQPPAGVIFVVEPGRMRKRNTTE